MSKIKPCDIPCPICGSLDIYRRYYSIGKHERHCHIGEKVDEFKTEHADYQRYDIKVKIPVIINACRTCSHNWESATLLEEKEEKESIITKKDIQKALKHLKTHGSNFSESLFKE